MMKNVVYTAPIVEVIEVEVEKGFAVSNGDFSGENGSPTVGQ